jgi:hypothetical protein
MDDLKPQRSFCVHGGTDRFPMTARIEAIGLDDMMQELAKLE